MKNLLKKQWKAYKKPIYDFVIIYSVTFTISTSIVLGSEMVWPSHFSSFILAIIILFAKSDSY